MSKLSFRARHLDPSKQMPIFLAEELPDLPEYSAINRAVPQMPSGMEKEEESEHHLQRAICTGLIIPTPEVLQTDQTFYDAYYPPDYKMPRQMIHMQPLGLDTEVPDYDMDSADEEWLSQQQRLELTELKFEQMMDRLEKSSGQTVVTLNEAKSLLNQDDETSISVYDYWLNKRLKMQHPLILTVKTESRPGASSNNPYLAFRRRTEKMQTRKNRKNDEASYEKMLKLRRDLQRATTILEMVRRREETKRDQLLVTMDILEKRVGIGDFNGAVYSELNSHFKMSRPVYNPLQYSQNATVVAGATVGTNALLAGPGGVLPPGLLTPGAPGATAAAGLYTPASQYLNTSSLAMEAISAGGNNSSRKEKRPYKKRKHKLPREKQQQQQQYFSGIGLVPPAAGVSPAHLSHLHHLHRQSASPAANESNVETEEDDYISGSAQNGNKLGSESEDEAPFAFRRKSSCNYLRTRQQCGLWPWEQPSTYETTNATALAKYRYTLTSINNQQRPRCIGFARRRLGRGGRVLFDRATTNFDDFWSQLDYTVLESVVSTKPAKKEIVKPSSPPTVVDLPTSTKVTDPIPPEIKVEPIDEAHVVLKPHHNQPDNDNVDVDEEDDFDDEDELGTDDENVSRLDAYSSALTLLQSPHDMRMRRRRLRRMKQQLRELNAAKRTKLANDSATGNISTSLSKESKSLPLVPLPRVYLHRLALALQRSEEKQQKAALSVMNDAGVTEEQVIKQEEVADINAVSEKLDVKQLELSEQQSRPNHQHHRSNNNTVLNNNNNSSSSNMNKNVSISDKFNVIKVEGMEDEQQQQQEEPVASTSAAAAAARAAEAAAAAVASAASTSQASSMMEDVAKTIKRELIDADDSNEPLSSIRIATVAMQQDLVDDEEDDVNLAQLSNIIRHTVKKELQSQQSLQQVEEKQLSEQSPTLDDRAENHAPVDDDAPCLNQMPDVIRLRNLRNCNHQETKSAPVKADDLYIDADMDEVDYNSGLSPTSSQRLDICNELLSEIRRDWLHFRPKTPTDILSDINNDKDSEEVDAGLVDWTQDTPITVELNRLTREGKLKRKTNINSDNDDPYFLSSAFKYTDLETDTQLLQTAYAWDVTRGSSKSPDAGGNSNSALDFNLSGGDSLTDINLLGDGDDETDENMLDNILQECGMDDPKALNQATNFWNGILDGEAAVDDVANEVASAEGLLDCIDDKKAKGAADSKRAGRHRGGKARVFNGPVGCSSFSVGATALSLREQQLFFSQAVPKAEPETPEIKTEPTEIVVDAAVQQPQQQQQLQVSVPNVSPAIATAPQVLNIPAQITQQQQQQPQLQLQKTQQPVTQLLTQFANVAQQAQLITRAPLQTTTEFVATATSGASVGDIVTITPHTGNSLSSPLPQQQQSLLQPQLPTLSHQQQQLQHQLQQAQLRNVTVQQRQSQPQQQQQQQQPLLFQMQRDIGNTPVITQYVSSASPAITSQTIVSSVANVRTAQTTLTPLSAGATGNHMIYTTTTGEIVTAAPSSVQKLAYAIQKSGGGGGGANTPTQMPGTIGPNTVITLSNVKLQNDGQSPSTNVLTIDGSGAAPSAGGTGAQSVNIINTASGQQVAVHSIAGMQLPAGVVASSAATPLIVTTPPRNNTQQVQVQQQPIVWRQLSGTTTSEAPATAVGNKILWTNRAGQKRQLNGPENTDINKLLLNRKFSQRKVIQGQPGSQQQQQIQLTKQQLQQLVQQEDEQLVVNATGNSDHLGLQESSGNASNVDALNQQQQQQQLQKLSKVIKMAPFPLLVSDLNQQKPNSAAAIAANHNYSLQPTAIITSQATPQQANKIFLTSSNSSGTGNFTIATASELQAAAANANNSAQKMHFKDLQNSNLKLNFVTTSTATVSAGDNLVTQAPQTQQVGATTVVLNKGPSCLPTSMQQQQQQQKLKTVSSSNASVVGTTQQGDRRVLYTSLLNVKPLQKNNTGQMQMQIGPSGLQQVLRTRLNNSAIFTRTLPLGTTVNSTSGGGSAGNTMQVGTSTPTTLRQLVSTNSNSVSTSDTGTLLTTTKEVSKALTVEQVIASANNGGVVMPSSNNNNNSGGGNSAGNGGGSGVTVTTTGTVNANAMTPTINR
ncbi:uncharacterized protein LOC115634683 [Scaptodrosophila lebanonensis]|uniref:Enhancer of polycomb-like protein n=1 Tax=Drosophila lebanonensis TaxID=7225 RepID=A0A6J2UJJ8_DROLE|nr:uncharacterized protein LOC115634683 [Scaptodrosophila lebanonensis]XP_030388403.1 uncharacterized protein LOC115634683 [Scaptodrosophila lebanonensis]XP_030388404.1 uncharacterized protein LOC115634683 [Scaptodrosophila lebanonensis]XP_030388405.1 uncharacterized protein LOC115634683 [Scaptodrosophila lebanonensis]